MTLLIAVSAGLYFQRPFDATYDEREVLKVAVEDATKLGYFGEEGPTPRCVSVWTKVDQSWGTYGFSGNLGNPTKLDIAAHASKGRDRSLVAGSGNGVDADYWFNVLANPSTCPNQVTLGTPTFNGGLAFVTRNDAVMRGILVLERVGNRWRVLDRHFESRAPVF